MNIMAKQVSMREAGALLIVISDAYINVYTIGILFTNVFL